MQPAEEFIPQCRCKLIGISRGDGFFCQSPRRSEPPDKQRGSRGKIADRKNEGAINREIDPLEGWRHIDGYRDYKRNGRRASTALVDLERRDLKRLVDVQPWVSRSGHSRKVRLSAIKWQFQAKRSKRSDQILAHIGLEPLARFRLMFSADLADSDDTDLAIAATAAFDVLKSLIHSGVIADDLRPDPAGTHAHAAWSLVHGLSNLVVDSRVL